MTDSHGNRWYCFECMEKGFHFDKKNHRSFKSDRAVWDHLNACHRGAGGFVLDDVVKIV